MIRVGNNKNGRLYPFPDSYLLYYLLRLIVIPSDFYLEFSIFIIRLKAVKYFILMQTNVTLKYFSLKIFQISLQISDGNSGQDVAC